jgi:hypothetical protein
MQLGLGGALGVSDHRRERADLQTFKLQASASNLGVE